MKGRFVVLLKLFGIVLLFLCIFGQIEDARAQLAQYELVWAEFKVLDKNGRPFYDAQLRARLDPRSSNQPLDKTISSGNISYSTEDYDYHLFDTHAQTVNKDGIATVPIIVYSGRTDCIDYELALLYKGKLTSKKTERYCFTLAETPASFVFKSDKPIPISLKDLAKYFLLFVGVVIVAHFLCYRPYYHWKIRKSYDIDRAEIYKNKALSLWGLLALLCLTFILYATLPPTPWMWGIIGLLGVLGLILLIILFK